MKERETTNDVFGFLTTAPNAEVKAIHPKAMTVILTTPAEVDAWLSWPTKAALALQRPLPDGSLRIVARGDRTGDHPEGCSLNSPSPRFADVHARPDQARSDEAAGLRAGEPVEDPSLRLTHRADGRRPKLVDYRRCSQTNRSNTALQPLLARPNTPSSRWRALEVARIARRRRTPSRVRLYGNSIGNCSQRIQYGPSERECRIALGLRRSAWPDPYFSCGRYHVNLA